MSGGSLDYLYSKFDEPLDKIQNKIRFGKGVYSEETLKLLREGFDELCKAKVWAQRIEWLFSGDDGEDSFKERVKEDLEEVKNGTIPATINPQCIYCKHHLDGTCELNTPKYRWFVYNEEDIKRRLGYLKNGDATECEEFEPGYYEEN